jgi:hypothetical protein
MTDEQRTAAVREAIEERGGPSAPAAAPMIDRVRLPAASVRVRRLMRGYRLALIDDPARLPETCHDRLRELLVQVAEGAFGADHTDYWNDHLEGSFTRTPTLAFALTDAGRVAGVSFSGRTDLSEGSALLLGTTMMTRAHQGRGLGGQLVAGQVRDHLRSRPRWPMYVTARTNNPVVYHSLRRAAGGRDTYPRPDGRIPPAIVRAAEQIVRWQGYPGYDPRTMIFENAYADFTRRYDAPPQCADPATNAFFRSRLGEHDAYLIVLRATPLNLAAGLARKSADRLAKAVRAGAAAPARRPVPR